MKPFILQVALFILLTVSAFLAVKIIFNKDQKNYDSAFVDKLKMLRANKNRKKIILLGGSGIGFGLSARMIEQETGITTINLGQNAGIGLTDFQSFFMKNINKDDIIIFSPEWVFYANPNFSDANLDNVITANHEYSSLIHGYAQRLEYLFSKINFVYTENEDPGTPYRYHCINKNGDVITQCNFKPSGPEYYKLEHAKFSVDQFKSTFPFLFTNKTIFLFPPTQVRVYNDNKMYLKQIENELILKKYQVVDRVKDNIYPDSLFFDLQYHLVCDARDIRTEKVIAYLKSNVLKN